MQASLRAPGWQRELVRDSCRSTATPRRPLSTAACLRSPAKDQGGALPRMYRYVVDVHGGLFLFDTTPKVCERWLVAVEMPR